MRRISVIGTSGSGKTTLARRLAAQLDLPHLELDAVVHQPGWTPLPDEELQRIVRDFCAADRWVVCGKYAQVRDLVFERADTIICLDHHRLRQTLRVAARTVGRVARRAELWNGNRESWRNLWPFPDGDASIVRWTWDQIPRVRQLFDEVEQAQAQRGVEVIRLRGWPAVDGFLEAAKPTYSKTTVRRP